MTPLEESIHEVAMLRKDFALNKSKLDGFYRDWCKENKDLIQCVENYKESVKIAEAHLRELIVSSSEDEVKSTFGAGIRNVKRYEYSKEEALFWAVDHKNYALLKLDTKKFEQAAEALELPGFIVNTERQATIARDLSKVI